MQKKKFWLWLLSIFMLALSIFSLTACKGKMDDMLYLGTYKGGRDTLIITKEYVNINGENYTYKIVDDKIRIEGSSSDLIFHNNYQVLSFEFLAEFDRGSITERNEYFNATLYNYGNGGILEAYTFKSDGTALYVNSSDTTKNKSATYRIKDGVIEITFMEIVAFQTGKTYWYVTENGQIYYDVYIKDVDTYFNDNGNNDDNNDNGNNDDNNDNGNNDDNNENGSTETPTVELCELTYTYGFYYDNSVGAYYEKEDEIVKIGIGSTIELKKPERKGYTFDGWSINGELKQAGETIAIKGNTTAYAEWTIDTYNITYHLGDGALENKKTSFTINDLPYELPTPIPQGELSFVKWTTDEAGKNEIKTITELGNYTLYAHYEDSAKCLTYKYNEELQGYEVSGYTGNAKEVKIPSTYKGVAVKSIGDSAFSNCDSLTSVKIPNSVTSIGYYAFSGCSSLTSIEIPDSVTSIGSFAFYYCSSLTSIEIPDSVTSIGSGAFRGCSSLTSIEIPDSVTSIGEYAFSGCSSLTSIEIPDSVTSIGSFAFYYCSSLTSIEIPDSVTSIGSYAFRGCSSLTSIEIPDSVTSIGEYAFSGCSSLTSIEIPDSVTSIGYEAFRDCSSLTSIEIPDSVTSIGDDAFYGCSNLKTWFIHSSAVANSNGLGELLQYATDVYIRADITVTVSIYNVVYNNLGKKTLNGVEYYHYQIKGVVL